MMDRGLLLIGGGGHCLSVIESLRDQQDFSRIGIIDTPEKNGQTLLGIPFIGSDKDCKRLLTEGYTDAFISFGSIGNPSKRITLFNKLSLMGFNMANVIDSSAHVGDSVTFRKGVYVGKHVTINAFAIIADCVIINTGAIIEHRCIIGPFAHIAPGVILCGEVIIGENTHIGAGSCVKQSVQIGDNCLIGMGSVVLKSISDGVTAYGNPCKEVTG